MTGPKTDPGTERGRRWLMIFLIIAGGYLVAVPVWLLLRSWRPVFGQAVDYPMVPLGVGFLLAGGGLYLYHLKAGRALTRLKPVMSRTAPTHDPYGRPIPGRPVPVIDPRTGRPKFKRSWSSIQIWSVVIGGIGLLLIGQALAWGALAVANNSLG